MYQIEVTVLGKVIVLHTTSDDLIFVSKVSIPNFSFLDCLEVGEKFVVEVPRLISEVPRLISVSSDYYV